MLKRLLASAGILICASTIASADHKPKPKQVNKQIAQLQADIRRDEAALAAAQRAGDKAGIAREQADLQRDRAQLQRLQAGATPPKPARPSTEGKKDKKDKKDKKHHKHDERDRNH
ncbi:MAG: hypothetical protein AUH43_25635 [Acidobacteria bacterium 13_1_40CM_65_14]|jgi:hypothetical protein|nr:MAG: hypothetical protein AUH43_25635 [Acidobacteria bacterium 13_1_40CM_65_14]OLC81821.1 MAG: hypothetical protein AUH72_08380 [Acidobacteria bacterium 13_1_40CM_4_65_8]